MFEADNIKFINRRGSSLFLNSTLGARAILINITVNEYFGNFLEATSNSSLLLNNSQFYNLDVSQSTPFIKISQQYIVNFPNLLNHVLFQNVQVKHSLFLLEKTLVSTGIIQFLNITMRNLKLKPIVKKSSLDLEYENEWVGGVCLLGRDSQFTLKDSLFENIYSHCIGLKSTQITLSNSTFTNAGLEDQPMKITDGSISERSGVSWLSLQREIPYFKNYVESCKFIENKIIPKYGGVR